MTVKLLHRGQLQTIGYPSGHVNWDMRSSIRSSFAHNQITIQKRAKYISHLLTGCGPMVPRGRVELPLSCENRILSPARLPVPPSGRSTFKRNSS